MESIIIKVGEEEFAAQLSDEHAPETCAAILAALPVQSTARQWGEEIYFEIPVEMDEENARDRVSKGDLGYWPAGSCFCLFYGKTPMSPSEQEIVPASPVNLIGRIEDPDGLKKHSAGETVQIRRAD
ncbi:MAG: cyclophilin-like fold protein [Candidatus Brocadiaceae bacterium]